MRTPDDSHEDARRGADVFIFRSIFVSVFLKTGIQGVQKEEDEEGRGGAQDTKMVSDYEDI